MPSRDLMDACSLLREAIPQIVGAYNGRYSPGYTARVGEVLRTQDEQQEKYAQGRTKPGKIITRSDGVLMLSNHQARLIHGETCSHAVDLNIFKEGGKYVDLERPYWPLIGLAIPFFLYSGGDWTHPDYPHMYCPYAKP